MIKNAVSLPTLIRLLSNGSNGQFIVVALNADLCNLVYAGKVEDFAEELAEQYSVTSVCSNMVLPDLVKIVIQQKFKLNDVGDSILVIGAENCCSV